MANLGKQPSDVRALDSLQDDEAQPGWQPQDAWFEAFGDGSNAPIILDPVDGLPRPADDMIDGSAPALSEDSFICMADERVWVPLRDHECDSRVGIVYDRAIGGGSDWDEDGNPVDPPTYTFDQLKKAFGVMWCVHPDGSLKYPVRPIRQKCEYLTRMLITDQTLSSTEGPVVPLHSYCRGFLIDGEPMSLGDQAVWACERRSPRDIVTEEKIVERVRNKIAQGKDRKPEPVFVPAAPAPPWIEQAAEINWSGAAWHIDGDPAVAPGKVGRLFCQAPSFVTSAWPKCDHICIVGTDWMPGELFSQKHMPGAGYHTLLLQPKAHLSGLAEPPPEWLDRWPRRIDPHLDMALQNQPAYLANKLLAGETVIVTSAKREWAKFQCALILAAAGRLDLSRRLMPTFPEGDHYFISRYPLTPEAP